MVVINQIPPPIRRIMLVGLDLGIHDQLVSYKVISPCHLGEGGNFRKIFIFVYIFV